MRLNGGKHRELQGRAGPTRQTDNQRHLLKVRDMAPGPGKLLQGKLDVGSRELHKNAWQSALEKRLAQEETHLWHAKFIVHRFSEATTFACFSTPKNAF